MNKHRKKVMAQLIGSWFRSFSAGCLACYMAGVTDWRIVLNAGAAAVLPVLYRYLNPRDSLGR